MSESRRGGAARLAFRLLAEFTVIVLGVLVALAVDAWSAERDAKVLEVELLRSLEADLRVSLERLENDNRGTRARSTALEWFLSVPIGPGASFPRDSLSSVTNAANVTYAYSPTLRTYETMVATGTFAQISSSEIQSALSDVKSLSEVYSDYRNQATQQWNDTYSMTWLEYMGTHVEDGGFYPSVPNPLPARSVMDALRSDLFRAVIDRRRIFLFFVAQNGDALATSMREALRLIEVELESRSE